MSHSRIGHRGAPARLALLGLVTLTCVAGTATAAAPGITASAATGATAAPAANNFNLVAGDGYSSQPDGVQIYSWGYGCASATAAAPATRSTVTFMPAQFQALGFCPAMQLPGPTLIVTEGQTVTVKLTNNLPVGAGNTSILFTGQTVTAASGTGATCTTQGLLVCEAVKGSSVTYTFKPSKPGTYAYYSGTQPDLQIEMGLYGALVVLPAAAPTGSRRAASCPTGEFSLAGFAYDHDATCYDREYLFQFGEIDPRIHQQVEKQVNYIKKCVATTSVNPTPAIPCPTAANAKLAVATEPYHPSYYLINGRSMPDDMDPDYAPNYAAQPYNGNPHMHPLEQVLLRVIGQGRWEHPFHEHANHVRILARDGNLLLSQTNASKLGGLMMFTTDTFPGQSFDGIFYWSGKGLNWDIYGHTAGSVYADGASKGQLVACVPDANGYYTAASNPPAPAGVANYGEWCADHNHPLEANPVGQVGAGGPTTLPDPLVATNGLWYNGTPYLGQDAVNRSRGPTPLPPGGALQNPPAESGIAFMWHSHNEREITTNDVFPGGMLMMMLVDPPVWPIDETL